MHTAYYHAINTYLHSKLSCLNWCYISPWTRTNDHKIHFTLKEIQKCRCSEVRSFLKKPLLNNKNIMWSPKRKPKSVNSQPSQLKEEWKVPRQKVNYQVIWTQEGGGGVHPIMAHMERLRPKGVPFSGLRYMKGQGFYLLKYMKG